MPKPQEWSISGLATEFGCDRRTVERWLAEHGIEPMRIEPHPAGDRCYYLFSQFWPLLRSKDIASSGVDIDSKSLDQIDKEIKFENARRLKRENDEAEKLAAPVVEMVRVMRPVIARSVAQIKLLPSVAASACKDVDGRGREKMEKAIEDELNEIARLPDRMLTAIGSSS